MNDLVGPGNTSDGSGGQPASQSQSSRSPAEAAIVIALAASIVAMAFHKDVSGMEALAALAALAIPESPGSVVKRLLVR